MCNELTKTGQMARENGEQYRTNAGVLRETITATIRALGEGKITPEEMPIDPKTKTEYIRYAPGYTTMSPAGAAHPYTVEALAKFLGELDGRDEPHAAFKNAFASLELISRGRLTEAQIKAEIKYAPGRQRPASLVYLAGGEDVGYL